MCRQACLALFLVTSPVYAAEHVASSALIGAAKRATLSQIDYTRSNCHDDRSVEAWLASVVGTSARSIKWSGGACALVNKDNPIDAGTNWCARAEIAPKRRGDSAKIEVFFEAPKRGRPGAPFAFRTIVKNKDGWDYMRDTSAFAANWRETYAPEQPAPAPYKDCGQ